MSLQPSHYEVAAAKAEANAMKAIREYNNVKTEKLAQGYKPIQIGTFNRYGHGIASPGIPIMRFETNAEKAKREEQEKKNRNIKNDENLMKNVFGVLPKLKISQTRGKFKDEQIAKYKPNLTNNLLGLHNNSLIKFPPREEELKGLFNVPSNKTRTRRRKNRKTLRKRR